MMVRMLWLGVVCGFLPAAAAAQDAELPARGQGVYAAQKCSICHAIAGKGNARGALDEVGAKLTGDEIQQWIVSAPEMAAKSASTRKPQMKAYALAKEDLDALVAYLQSLKKS
jgi:mono/diheme cytochrome c family protein